MKLPRKERSMTHIWGGGQGTSTETVLEKAKIAVLLDKDIYSGVTHRVKQLKETALRELKSKA